MPNGSDDSQRPPAAVLFDALGTTVALEPPAPRLAAVLGVELDSRLRSAVREEMRHYKAHALHAADADSLAELRETCAGIVAEGIGRPVSADELMASIRFRAYPDAAPALRRLRAAGIRTACVSNWDFELPEVLRRVGLAELFDVVVTSAEVGAAKPDPRPFEVALRRLEAAAESVVHVGDTEDEDVAGARAAGIEALLIDRDEQGRRPSGSVGSLAELADTLLARGPGERS